MFEDQRDYWAEVTGRRVLSPPPMLPPSGLAGRLRVALLKLASREPRRYRRFFLQGLPLLVSRRELSLFTALEHLGLALRLAPSIYAPLVRLFPLTGKLIATDLLGRVSPDQVFSLMFEQVYLVRNMEVRPGDRVLELCVGSGVNSLFAADGAKGVTGVDLNPRALDFSRFNAALNGTPDSLELLEGDLFEPVAGREFDLILVNPPFEFVPEGGTWFEHSHGGEDGLDVVRRILDDAPIHLAPNGRIEMITWSPGSARGADLVPLMQAAFPDSRLTVDILQENPIEEELVHFEAAPGYQDWRRRLAARGLDRAFMIFARADPRAARGLEIRRPNEEVADCEAISCAW